ncbi:MAG: hypothetical protein ACT6S0_07390 [Roseateles sp.]|uniref:hypothetical protein n=1 Tax=Roseateles sp. TaxID=1971397 RepID=UPI0040359B48
MTMNHSQVYAAFVLLPFLLGGPALAFSWELRSGVLPFFLLAVVGSVCLMVRWLANSVKPWWMGLLTAGAVLVVCGAGLLLGLFVWSVQSTQLSLRLDDECRVDVERVGALGDIDLHVSRYCTVGGLWEARSPLLSDQEATVSRLRLAPPWVDGTAQVTVTLSRYGKPGEDVTLRLPPR